MLKKFLLLFVSVLILSCSSTAQDINFEDNWKTKKLSLLREETFDVNQNEKLLIEVIGSDVEVHGWDKDEAYIKVYGKKSEEKKYKLYIGKDDDVLKIKMKKRGSSFLNIFRSFKGLYFEIYVPNKFIVECSSSGGDLSCENIDGKFTLSTSGGDINLLNCNGKKDLSTSGGDIKLENCNDNTICSTSGGDIELIKVRGDVDLSTSGGDIKVIDIVGKIDGSTSGGDITVRYNGEIKGPIDLSTTGGDVMLSVPEDFKCKLSCDTSGGSIEINHNSSYGKLSRSSFNGTINKGTILVNLETTGGDIKVNSN